MLVTRILNQATRGHYVEAYIWRLTSLLVVRHIAEIETQACCFQWMHVNHTHFSAMQADTSKKVTWL